MPLQVDEMIHSYMIHDLGKMGALAHKIKPNIDSFNITLLKQEIREIENAGQEKSDLPNLKDLLDHTQKTIALVVQQMKKDYPN
jgi:hypothetical protein